MTSMLVVLLAAELPDIGQPSIVAYGMALGGLAGGFVARVGRHPSERVSRLTLDGAFAGGLIACAAWVLELTTPYLR